MFTFLARLLRMATNCATVEDVDGVFNRIRNRYIKIQKKSIKEQRSEDHYIKEAQKRKERQERTQKQAEKRIEKMNNLLED
jgi:rRNA processing protein Gar1